MRITVLGAGGGQVTGSCYWVQTSRANVFIDAGMFQGDIDGDRLNVVPAEVDLERLDAIVVTHAHLDHTGRLPLLTRHGYRGPIFTTPATIDLSSVILNDAAKLQAQDALRINRKRERAGELPIEPLYSSQDVQAVLELMRPVDLGTTLTVAEGVQARFFEAGHILGSASIELTITEDGKGTVVVFSGDLGPTTMPIIREFNPPTRADVVFLESTYGDRDHRAYAATVAEFDAIVAEVSARRGKMLVPTFAIGRAQQLLYQLALLFRAGTIKPFPVYLDSPMAIEATRLYRLHAELFDEELLALHHRGLMPLGPEHFHATVTAEESKKLNDLSGPCVILAGAGMCTGGRILHHLKQNLWRPDTHVMIAGFQARGSLGRQLVEGVKTVMVHGEPIAVRGRIHTLGGFSAHAGQTDLLKWFEAMVPSRPRVILTHGEDGPRTALAQQLRSRFHLEATLPDLGQVLAF